MSIESRPIAVTSTSTARLRDIVATFIGAGPRLLGAVRAWASASQLGPMHEKEIGRRTGART